MGRAPRGYRRVCRTCRKSLPLADFPPSTYGTGNGRSVVCKGCTTNPVWRNRNKPLVSSVDEVTEETKQAWAQLRADREEYGG